MEWKKIDRVPLSKGDRINIKGCVIVSDDAPHEVDEGTTCLVYRGHVETGMGIIPGTKVIIKEFYPYSKDTVLDMAREKYTDEHGEFTRLVARGLTKGKVDFQDKLVQFMRGVELQKELARSKAMEVAIKPWIEGEVGDSYYIVSDIHDGCDMAKVNPNTLAEKLEIAISTAESMSILHESGYIMIDFKPNNLMYIQKPSTVRIIDTDSLVKYRERMEKRFYANRRYASPELRSCFISGDKKEVTITRRSPLLPISDIYALGALLLEMFWGWLPNEDENDSNERPIRIENVLAKKMKKGQLLQEFVDIYKDEVDLSVSRLKEVGNRLIDIIQKATYNVRHKRKVVGFDNAMSMMRELNEVYQLLTSKRLVSRKEIAKANASFAAYNMLEQHPLFKYTVKKNVLSVTFAGNHMMLDDMFGAVLSMGQMLNKKLQIHLVGQNMVQFWEQYTSEEKNAALKSAVIVSKDGEEILHEIDTGLVDRPLAEIMIHTADPEEKLTELLNECAYYILLEEEAEKNRQHLQTLANGKKKIFAGYLQSDEDDTYEEVSKSKAELYGISVESFSETYNEKMFSERIFKMGMMAHAYYNKCMEENVSVDLEKLEKEFKKDIYSIESSERCALHSLYKLASLGIPQDKPGRILNYYRAIQDEKTLEKLAYLEHLSWTAYMLCTGAKPASLEEFDVYAYQGQNDWKNKEDKKHLKHPLLAASKPVRKITDEMWEGNLEKNMDKMDPLDKVSYHIHSWYVKQKEEISAKFERMISECGVEFCEKQEKLVDCGRRIIEGIGEKRNSQCLQDTKEWEKLISKVKDKQIHDELVKIMKPAIDSYRDCDFKRLDRELVFAAVDMIV